MTAKEPPARIAFGGRMQVGKTTAADRLVARHGYRKYAIADPIKRVAAEGFGWDGAKDGRGRRLLQEIGTVGRRYDPELWLRRLAEQLDAESPTRAVVDDLRLAREVEALESMGFVCVRIDRPRHLVPQRSDPDPPGRPHETEGELDGLGIEDVIDNAGTIDDLYWAVDRLVAGVGDNRKAPRDGGAFGVQARRKR